MQPESKASLLVVVVGLAFVGFVWADENYQINYGIELSDSELKESKKMADDLKAIEQELDLEDLQPASSEELLNAIEALVKSRRIKDGHAVKLLLALRGTGDSCELDSFRIFSKIVSANFLPGPYDYGTISSRINRLVAHYLGKHAQKCRPVYKAKFHQLLEQMQQNDPKSLERVQAILGGLTYKDLAHFKFDGTLALIRTIAVIKEISFKEIAAESVATQIANKIKEDNPKEWKSFKESSWSKRSAKALLKEYLFKPCDRYSKHFEAALAPGKLVASVMDDQQASYLKGDLLFTRAIVNRLLCKHLADITKEEKAYLLAAMKVMHDSPEVAA